MSRPFNVPVHNACHARSFFVKGILDVKALISRWIASAKCVWCEKTKECVTVEFGDGFLAKNSLCWRCLAKVVKVRSQDQSPPENTTESSDHQNSLPDKRTRRDAS